MEHEPGELQADLDDWPPGLQYRSLEEHNTLAPVANMVSDSILPSRTHPDDRSSPEVIYTSERSPYPEEIRRHSNPLQSDLHDTLSLRNESDEGEPAFRPIQGPGSSKETFEDLLKLCSSLEDAVPGFSQCKTCKGERHQQYGWTRSTSFKKPWPSPTCIYCRWRNSQKWAGKFDRLFKAVKIHYKFDQQSVGNREKFLSQRDEVRKALDAEHTAAVANTRGHSRAQAQPTPSANIRRGRRQRVPVRTAPEQHPSVMEVEDGPVIGGINPSLTPREISNIVKDALANQAPNISRAIYSSAARKRGRESDIGELDRKRFCQDAIARLEGIEIESLQEPRLSKPIKEKHAQLRFKIKVVERTMLEFELKSELDVHVRQVLAEKLVQLKSQHQETWKEILQHTD